VLNMPFLQAAMASLAVAGAYKHASTPPVVQQPTSPADGHVLINVPPVDEHVFTSRGLTHVFVDPMKQAAVAPVLPEDASVVGVVVTPPSPLGTPPIGTPHALPHF
jgi:hypothetical protein